MLKSIRAAAILLLTAASGFAGWLEVAGGQGPAQIEVVQQSSGSTTIEVTTHKGNSRESGHLPDICFELDMRAGADYALTRM